MLSGTSSVLTASGSATVYINATGASLDSLNNYVLFKLTGAGASISGAFNAQPQWIGTPPGTASSYTVGLVGNNVVLQLGGGPNSPVIGNVTANGGYPGVAVQNETVPVLVAASPGATSSPVAGGRVTLAALGGTNVGTYLNLVSDTAGNFTNKLALGLGIPVGPIPCRSTSGITPPPPIPPTPTYR